MAVEAALFLVAGAATASAVPTLAGAFVVSGAIAGAIASRATPRPRAIAALVLVLVAVVLAGVPLVAFGPPLTRAGMRLVVLVETTALASASVTLGGLAHGLRARWPVLRVRARRWLVVSAVVVGAFGAAFAFAPGLTEPYWDAVLYRGAPPAAAHGPEIRVVFGVLGAVLAGWMALVVSLAYAPAPPWSSIATSTCLWFVLDSAYSCIAGAEGNAVSNAALALPLALCLAVLVAARPLRKSPRPIVVRTELELPMPAQDAFDLVTSVDGMLLFRGFGAVPGIARVTSSPGPRRVGTTDHVTSSDGTSHDEAVTEHAPARVYSLRIGPFTSPLGRLVSHMVERWTFADTPEGARVRRTFHLHPKHGLARLALALLVAPQLLAAMRRHHAALRASSSSLRSAC